MTSNNTMLVYLGANAHKELAHQLLELNPAIRFISSHVYPEAPSSLLEDKLYRETVITFDSAIQIESGKIKFTLVNDYNLRSVIDAVMNDKHLSLLWTRFNGETRRCNQSEVKRYEVIYSLIKSALETCLARRPTAVVFSYEPHMLPIYVFKKVCIALGIRTYTMIISPFNWRVFLEKSNGTNHSWYENCLEKVTVDIINDSVKRFIDEKKSDYSVAKPFYEKRYLKRPALFSQFLNRLKVNGWKPHRAILGQIAYAEYKRLSSEREDFQDKKYICVFLQLQPEQTTLPDGGLFVHHLFVIQMLYSAVSSLGISLVIREHPATFESTFDPKWRPEDFYSAIKSIGPDIYFDRIKEDPYILIKNCVAASAITGTVLLESLLHGRPAIAFGKHPLWGLSAPGFIDSFGDEVELREKITIAMATSRKSIISDVEKFLYEIYPKTFGPAHYAGNSEMTLERLRESRYVALCNAIESILIRDGSITSSI